ncbi:hypothetical protein HNY73_016938 [Argiope bruennichi]|uniref:Uncharacterized protein n=1 Tax=Argiope bruennichi TaxID=94029 RepID=A0A8T0ELT9_ARGBR|nr:hypothetical protein HNY73_016938 [Argiope bruennichi]
MRFTVYSGFTKVARCPSLFLSDVTTRPIIRATNSPDIGESYIRAQLENFPCVIRRLDLKAGVNNGLAGQMLGTEGKITSTIAFPPSLCLRQWGGKEFSEIVFLQELSSFGGCKVLWPWKQWN